MNNQMKTINTYDSQTRPWLGGITRQWNPTSNGVEAKVSALARIITQEVIMQHPDGFTFNPRKNVCLPLGLNTNPDIYVASIAGHELRLPGSPTEEEVAGWLHHRLDLLSCKGKFIGGWPFNAEHYLDVSVLVRGEQNAFAFARANHQRAIFHPATGQSIPVETVFSAPLVTAQLVKGTIHDQPLEAVSAQ